ncbi:MAG: hypothetical protein ABMB14_30405 [Myxococcota bacterium]
MSVAVGLPVEYDVVGHNYGIRPELVWAPGGRPIHGLRVAFGVLPSQENLFLPGSVGWRARTGPEVRGHLLAGAGAEVQTFVFTDRAPDARPSLYLELGGGWSASDRVDLGALVVPELAPFGVPGIGLGLRLAAWVR